MCRRPGGAALRPCAPKDARQTSLGQARSEVLLVIREIQRADARSLRTIAAALNARGVARARGGRQLGQTVSNVLAHSVQSRRCTELRRPSAQTIGLTRQTIYRI